jgi:hypothetical protein
VPKRSSLRDRLGQDQARGQEAIYGQPEPATTDRLPSTTEAGWEATHHRVTFYCPLDLLGALEAEMRRSGRSKSRVIVDALREHLIRR